MASTVLGRKAFDGGAMLSKALKERPIATNFVLSGLLGLASDAICQFGVERKTLDSMDNSRFFGMGSFAATYSMVKLQVYKLYPRVLPALLHKTPFRSGITSSLLDGCVHSPLLYLPTYYVYTGACRGESIRESLEVFRDQFKPVMTSLMTIWVPVQAINFSLVPPTHRVLFVCVCNLVWNTVLDWQSHHLAAAQHDVMASAQHEVLATATA